MKQECVKATAMHEVCKTKYGCGVDKSKTTVSLCNAAPGRSRFSLQFSLMGEGDLTQSKQPSVKVLCIIMLGNTRANLNALKRIYIQLELLLISRCSCLLLSCV